MVNKAWSAVIQVVRGLVRVREVTCLSIFYTRRKLHLCNEFSHRFNTLFYAARLYFFFFVIIIIIIIIIIIVVVVIEFLTSQLWLGNIHLSWDVVINRVRLGGLICSLKSSLQLNMCQELQVFVVVYM